MQASHAATIIPSPYSQLGIEVGTTGITDSLTPGADPWSDSHALDDGMGDQSFALYTMSTRRFDMVVSQANAGTDGSAARAEGNLYFSVDETVQVVFDSQYDTIGPARHVVHSITLRPADRSEILIRRMQVSSSTPDESFSFPDQEGDLFNSSVGPTSVQLVPDVEYELFYTLSIAGLADDSSGPGTATGSLAMILVPEPSAFVLIASGSLLAAAAGRRRTRPARSAPDTNV